ncbi:Piso0_005287 [Millerozyma farinosa CBS 7064]|uniref:Piso0_005287 protein n=1 Tax=Pichia sorbitophila (strain ATCC MYA-4447 / BCRC 22081 / CBS 7064 / NBRC 10061 / NRRL Y-12695) TaxID=559304 RepID=G8Y4P9_PICSO|nr:Piso0_005287 [Millerozyma farinosa CBS 7064]
MDAFESDIPRIPDYSLSEKEFLLKKNFGYDKKVIQEALLDAIKKDKLAPYYRHLHEELPDFPFDEALYNKIDKENKEHIAKLEQKITEASDEEEADLDLYSCQLELAHYYTKICDRKNAVEALKRASELTQSTGSKIDIYLTLIRIDFFFEDYFLASKNLEQIKTLIDKGGDWERRNRYKTYHGIYLMATRNFSEAAKLLIDSLATFTSTELCSYEQVTQYAVVSGILSLDRLDLKAKVIDSPEILSISTSTQELEPLLNLTNSLYTCQYNYLFQYLLESYDKSLLPNKYLHKHADYILREMRCKAYGQLLESYKSLSLSSMAKSFNVSEAFLDEDLCRFIPNKKLNCTIDSVNGIIITNRPDNKNNQYHQFIKQGDNLLTKLQKYAAAVKLSGAERVA